MRADEPRQDVAPADFRQERDLLRYGISILVGGALMQAVSIGPLWAASEKLF